MIRSYSQRMLPPYSGFVQIAETARARAHSFDGSYWEIQYRMGEDASNPQQMRAQGYASDRNYFKIAHIQNGQLTPYIVPACLDAADTARCIEQLTDYLATAQLPFPAADRYEFWLLDEKDQSPLALLLSCCEKSQMSGYPTRAEWVALPHSKMQIDNTEDESSRGEPPVNHRFQRMISWRAGSNPKAAWFNRSESDAVDFPCFLVREDWQSEAEHDLCQRYLSRKSPRLLMLQGLQYDDRERMELAAKGHAIEVDEYFPLYPAINNQKRMSALRVEAQLRRRMPEVATAKTQKKDSGPTPLSKDMRILE